MKNILKLNIKMHFEEAISFQKFIKTKKVENYKKFLKYI